MSETNVSVENVVTANAKRINVKATDFITAWEKNDSIKSVATALGMKETSVQARAAKCRADGLPLKKMQRGSTVKKNPDVLLGTIAACRGITLDALKAEIETAKAQKVAQ